MYSSCIKVILCIEDLSRKVMKFMKRDFGGFGLGLAAPLFWFFGDFRCGVLLFMVFSLYFNIKIGKNSC